MDSVAALADFGGANQALALHGEDDKPGRDAELEPGEGGTLLHRDHTSEGEAGGQADGNYDRHRRGRSRSRRKSGKGGGKKHTQRPRSSPKPPPVARSTFDRVETARAASSKRSTSGQQRGGQDDAAAGSSGSALNASGAPVSPPSPKVDTAAALPPLSFPGGMPRKPKLEPLGGASALPPKAGVDTNPLAAVRAPLGDPQSADSSGAAPRSRPVMLGRQRSRVLDAHAPQQGDTQAGPRSDFAVWLDAQLGRGSSRRLDIAVDSVGFESDPSHVLFSSLALPDDSGGGVGDSLFEDSRLSLEAEGALLSKMRAGSDMEYFRKKGVCTRFVRLSPEGDYIAIGRGRSEHRVFLAFLNELKVRFFVFCLFLVSRMSFVFPCVVLICCGSVWPPSLIILRRRGGRARTSSPTSAETRRTRHGVPSRSCTARGTASRA
jgi:hypothetical protein